MLSDLAKGDGESASPLAIAIKPEPLDPMKAMSRFVKAVHANDVEGAYDAFCLLSEAHEDEKEKAANGDDGDGNEDGEDKYK